MVKSLSLDKNGVRKGAWNKEEDEKLRAYIQRYGHWKSSKVCWDEKLNQFGVTSNQTIRAELVSEGEVALLLATVVNRNHSALSSSTIRKNMQLLGFKVNQLKNVKTKLVYQALGLLLIAIVVKARE
ncbi:hypothetical protein M8C21_027801, partial [Ambrosia artemisiifolia]